MDKVFKRHFSNRIEYWDSAGRRHREDGPAVEYFNGNKYWFRHGKRHRLYGPAELTADGSEFWWLDGKEYGKFGYWHEVWDRYAIETATLWISTYKAFYGF